MKASVNKATVAHCAPCREVELEWTAQQLVKDIRKLGYHSRVVLRSDQEPGIAAPDELMVLERSDTPKTVWKRCIDLQDCA